MFFRLVYFILFSIHLCSPSFLLVHSLEPRTPPPARRGSGAFAARLAPTAAHAQVGSRSQAQERPSDNDGTKQVGGQRDPDHGVPQPALARGHAQRQGGNRGDGHWLPFVAVPRCGPVGTVCVAGGTSVSKRMPARTSKLAFIGPMPATHKKRRGRERSTCA